MQQIADIVEDNEIKRWDVITDEHGILRPKFYFKLVFEISCSRIENKSSSTGTIDSI